jgi:hypothetical protein
MRIFEESHVEVSCPEERAPGPASATAASAKDAVVEFIGGVITGTLVAFREDGVTPLVLFPDQPGSVAIAARTVVDLRGTQLGGQVVLMFENGEARRPIVMGVLQLGCEQPLSEEQGSVEVEADGRRLLVNACEELVLRCGRASITLTKEGKVLIQGTYVSHRSAGVMRIKGGSVQLN